MRVPSDKVPRAATNREDDYAEPPEPPEPEAPELAVSVAAAFGGADEPEAPGADAAPAEGASAVAVDEPDADAPSGDEAEAEAVDDEPVGEEEGDAGGRGADAAPAEAEAEAAEEDEPDAEDEEAAVAAGESVDIPIDEDVEVRRPHRAQTEALTEEDLEELMEPIEDDDDELSAVAPAEEDDDKGDDDVDFDAQETAQFVPVVIDDEPDEDVGVEGDASEGAGVTLLERREVAAEARAAPSDAGDSAEMLSEEHIEEIDEAAPQADAASDAATKPPPAPVASGFAQAGKGRLSAQGKAWFDEIFDEDYLRTLPFLTPQATQAEARFVTDAIAAAPGAQVLDVGCGYGRHAMELAARGFHVVGLDSSLPLLLRGADEAQRRGLSINFVHGDMRELTFDSQFDAAYCLFSTFGYFDDETNKKTAQNISRALKPGARLVLEILNRDYLIQDLPTRVWWEGDGCVVLEEVDFNYFSSRIVSNRSVVFDDGRQLEHEISIRAYSLHEIGKLLHAAGFRVLEVSGSMNTRGRFFGAKARDIIVVAEKRGATG